MRTQVAVFILALAVAMTTASGEVLFPGTNPGPAKSVKEGQTFVLENDVIAMAWEVRGETLVPTSLVNKLTGQQFDQHGCPLFRLTKAKVLSEQPVLTTSS